MVFHKVFLTNGFRTALTISIIRGLTPLSALTPPRPSDRHHIPPRTRSRSTRYRAMMCIIAARQSLHQLMAMIANTAIRPGGVAARRRTRRHLRKVSARLKIGQRTCYPFSWIVCDLYYPEIAIKDHLVHFVVENANTGTHVASEHSASEKSAMSRTLKTK
jgi:hypothetical protein